MIWQGLSHGLDYVWLLTEKNTLVSKVKVRSYLLQYLKVNAANSLAYLDDF